MKRFSEQFYKKAETVKLTVAERDDLKERLLAYMEYHPLSATQKQGILKQADAPVVVTESFMWVTVPYRMIFKVAIPTAVLLLVIMPFVAERAVPGDALYAVKQVNEELRSTLIFDSYQRVEWETERINRRIAEARLLASEGRLTEAVEVSVAEAVMDHTESAKRQIEVLRTEDNDEAEIASIALDTTLEVQSTALKGEVEGTTAINPVTGESEPHTSLIATAIDASREPVVEGEELVLPAYSKLMARVELNTTRIYELRGNLMKSVLEEQLADVDRRTTDIERSIEEAIGLSNATGTIAQEKLVDVLQRTQKLIVYMTELEVNTTVDIEDIVPVVLTEGEENSAREAVLLELNQKASQIDALTVSIEDEAVLAKTVAASSEIARMIEEMASGTVTYDRFVTLSTDARTLADDTLKVLEQAGVTVTQGEVLGEVIDAHASGTDESAPSEEPQAPTSEGDFSEGEEVTGARATDTDYILPVE